MCIIQPNCQTVNLLDLTDKLLGFGKVFDLAVIEHSGQHHVNDHLCFTAVTGTQQFGEPLYFFLTVEPPEYISEDTLLGSGSNQS